MVDRHELAGGLVDVHAHFTTGRYIEAASAAGHREPDGMPGDYWPRWNAGEHLDLMDQAGIATAMLSISSPGVHFGDAAAARELAREVNDAGAEIVRAHPGRFGLFASLPAPDTDAALAEAARAFDELGAAGVILMTNSRGAYLGDDRLTPVLAELDRRRAVLFLHPTSTEGHEHVDGGRPRPMIEFLFDTARTIVDFILSGAARRFPGLRVIVPHMGGVLPLVADRVELLRSVTGGADPIVFESLRRLYYDLAGAPNAAQLTALRSIAAPDRLVYGSDHAWTPREVVLSTLARLDALEPAGWRAQTTRNAGALLRP
ncbi:amidohydrolase family protein [Amycolatopsis saalfeldensis]|uniref:6-methylsalicylate decarboxylase n=1 Tax=Amycolatopsis saalfeldensis TaxID=394193 RepID=A0A1H8XFE3_9PSEU|nr:amidohydrolase family protein [Amycolatopsis saalfeldensis]SEP38744.1 Predicted metal-dependent hydrolase, TIM-barrel fold [Amycolatopsis saalfeldensis]